ncbi:hypothetical protein NYA22BAC_02059 [Parasphingorhabdus sp. NYA22]
MLMTGSDFFDRYSYYTHCTLERFDGCLIF